MKKLIGVFVLTALAAVMILSGCRPPELEGVVINMNQGLYDKAYDLAQEAVKKYPTNPEAWYLLGDLHARNEKFVEMNEAFEKSLELSLQFQPQIEQGRMKYFAENYNSGLRNFYDKARDVEDPEQRKELFSKAADKFLKSHQAMPSRTEPLTPMSVSFMESGDTATAEKYILKAIDMNPDNDTLMVTVGDFYFKISELEKAKKLYQKAVSVNENNIDAHLALGEIYAENEQWDEAVAEFKKGMELQPSNAAIPLNISIIFYNNGKYEEAIPHIKKTLELDPTNEDMYELLSLSYMQSAQKYHDLFEESEKTEDQEKSMSFYEEALPFLEEAITKFPNSALIWNNLGVCYAQKGMKEKAQEAFEKQKELEGTE
jgi:tetratricopeptide (TPR) repeat protein